MPKPKRELSKCRIWEKERRERLKTCFEALDRVLPNHDPTVTSSKLEILQRAASHITELQRKNKELVLGDVQLQSTAQRDEVRRLRERVRKLTSRAEQLAGLLRAAGLRVPKECVPNGVFRGPPRLWSGRVSKEKAEQLRTQHEQENDPKAGDTNSPEKTNKRKRKRIVSPGKKSGNNGDLGTGVTTPISKKVAFSPRNTNNNANVKRSNGINRRRNSTNRSVVVSNTTNNTTTSTQLANGVAASVAAVLGPGTLILANGSVVPVPAPRVTSTITTSRTPLPATLQRIQLVPVTTAPPPPVILMQRNSNTTNNTLTSKFPNIQPKTASGKMNRPNLSRKVPIPVLRSNHLIAARKHSLQQQRKEKLKASTEAAKSSTTDKSPTTNVTEKSTSVVSSTITTPTSTITITTTTVTVTKSSEIKQKQIKPDPIVPSDCANNAPKTTKDELPKTNTNVNASKSEVLEKHNLSKKSDGNNSACDTLTTNQSKSDCSIVKQKESNTSVPSSDPEPLQQKQKVSIINIEKVAGSTTIPSLESLENNKPEKETQKQSQEQKELEVEQCRNQLQAMHADADQVPTNHIQSDLQQINEHQTNELQVNQVEHQEEQHQSDQLNDQQQQQPDEHHSELSNDIFASLQDGTGSGVMGSQHTESMSPTAAFLLAFPLVSTLTGNGRGNEPTAHGSGNGDGRALNGSSGGNGNNNSSDDDGGRQGTPTTLLQIGGTITLDNNTNTNNNNSNNNNNNNKQIRNEEVPRALDNFAYFNTRDNQQYSTIREHTSSSLEPIVSNTCLYEQQSHMPTSSQPTIGYNNDTTDTYSNNIFTELRNTNNEHQQQTNQSQNQHQSVYSSCLAKDKSTSKQQRNNKNISQQQQQYRAPVNWMTSPDVRPTYTHQHYQHASTPSSLGTGDFFLPPFSDVYGSNSGSLDHNAGNEHPPFTWSPTTARSTLPTLIGDLALGVNPPANNLTQPLDQQLEQHQSKDIANSTAPFLSVSSLVNGNKQHRSKQQSTQQTKRHRDKTNKSRANNNNINTSITNANPTTTSSTNTIANNSSIITTSYMNNVNSTTKRSDNTSSYIISGVNQNAKRTETIPPYINNGIKRIDNSLYIDNNALKRPDNSYINNSNPSNSKRTGNVPYMDNINTNNSNMKRNENNSYNDNNNSNKRSAVGGYSAEALISSDNTNMQNHMQHQTVYSSAAYDQRTNNYVLPSGNNGCVIDSSQHSSNNNNQHNNYQGHQNNQHQIQSNHLQQHSQHQHHSNIHNSSTFSANTQHRQSHSTMHNTHNNNSNNNNNNQQSSTSFPHITSSSTSTFTQMTPSSTFSHMTTSVSLPNMIISSASSSFPHMSSAATSSFSHMNSPVSTASSFGHMPSASFGHHHPPPPPPPLGAPPSEYALLSAAVADTYSKTFDTFVHVKPPVPPPPPPLVSTLAMTTVTSSISTAGNFDSYCGSSTHNTRSHISSSGEGERRRHSSSTTSSSRRTANNNNNANTSVTASTFSELSFLTMSGAVSSPLLPDEYHSATAFLSNATPSVSVPVPPPMPPTASSLTNFNLSAIFPEINKATSSLPISSWSSSSKSSASSSRSQNRYHHQNQSHQQNHTHGHQQQQQQQRNSNHSTVQTNSVNTAGYRQQHHQYHQQFPADPMYVAASNSNNTNTSGTQFSSMLPHHQVQAFNGANSTGNSISTSIPGSGVDISTTSASATFSFSFTSL